MTLRRDTPKSRAWAEKRSELKRSGPPKRKTRIRPVNRARAAKRFARNFNRDEYVAWTNEHCCLFCGRHDETIRCAHILHSRGAGGDWRVTGPACADCDGCWEGKGRHTFLRSRRLTWAEVEYRVAAHQRSWDEYERRSVTLFSDGAA